MLKIRLIALLVFSAACFTNSQAQQKTNALKISTGLEQPVGEFGDAYKSGFGIFFTDYYGVSKKGSIVFVVGTSSWKAKAADIRGNLSQIKVGFRQFLVSGLYLQADGGWGRYTGTWGGGNRFVYSGGAGYLLKTKGINGIDFNIRISQVPNRSWVGLGIGYQFKL